MREEIISFTENNGEPIPFIVQMSGISYCDGSYKIDRKNSSIYCFEYILKGQGTVTVNGREFTPVEGDIYMLHKGDDHLYYSDDKSPWVKIWFNIKGPLIDSLVNTYGLGKIYHIQGLDLKNLFYSFYETCRDNQGNLTKVYQSTSIIFHEILIHISNHIHVPIYKQDEIAVKIKQYLDNHIDSNVTIKELGAYIYRSSSQTIRIFKKEFGITPYDYFLSKKIETAKLLLLNTNLSIKEISTRLKFVDEHYFSNYFKQQTGKAPKNYREQFIG